MSAKLVVWMVNYHSWELIEKAIGSIGPEICEEIVVLDNSTDGEEWTRLLELRAADRRLLLHRSSSNVGFGAAMNRIAKLAPGRSDDVIWLLNPDTEVLAFDLEDAVRALEGGFAMVSPVIVQGRAEEEQRIWFSGGTVDLERGAVEHLRFGRELTDEDTHVQMSEFMTGAAPILYRSTFDVLGGFEERLFLYWEDVDLSLRVARAGMHMAVIPSARVWHLEGGSGEGATGRSPVYYRYMARNRLLVCRMHGTGLMTLLVRTGASETLKTVLRPLIHERSGKFAKVMAALVGTFEGITGNIRAKV